MKCTYCNEPGYFNVIGTSNRCCDRCMKLYRDQEWDSLARVWLECRPGDWVGDVAAYIEQSSPKSVVFNQIRPHGPHDVPADLVDMDPSDWLDS